MRFKLMLLLAFSVVGFNTIAYAETAHLAVASNFSITMKKLVADFESRSEHTLSISAASTGKLFAQIINGAPYDLFFSADEKRVDLLTKKGLSERSKIYARGKLVFIGRDVTQSKCRSVLNQSGLKKLALANPKTAPYGQAAKQVLMKLGKWDQFRFKIVMGENVLQAYQFIASGSVDVGFIAASLVVNSAELDRFCRWEIPASFYQPVMQKMALLKRANKNSAATAFYHYMQSAKAKTIIRNNGYIIK